MQRLAPRMIALLLLLAVAGCNGTDELTPVPDVIGLNEVEAVERLEAAGFDAAAAAERVAEESHGTVVGQEPEPGSRVEVGRTVTLTVARDGSSP